MKLLTNKDVLGRTAVLCEDEQQNLVWAIISKKNEENKDMNYIFSELLKAKICDEELCKKLSLFGFMKIKLALKK